MKGPCSMSSIAMYNMPCSAASNSETACSFARFLNIVVIMGTILTMVSIIFAFVSVSAAVVPVVRLINVVLVLIVAVLLIKRH